MTGALKPYKEGREYITPVKGKDGKFYILFFNKPDMLWEILRVSAKQNPNGGRDYDDKGVVGGGFETYREAWLYFLDCLEGKEPDYETWKAPKEK